MASPRKTEYGHQITDSSFSAVSTTVTAQGDNCDTAADRANAAADALDGTALSVSTDSTIDGDGRTVAPLGLADNGVTTAKITDANVTTAKLASGAVTTVKITDANVTAAKLASSSVTTAKIATDAVTLAKLQNMAAATIIGRANGAGTGDPTHLTAAQVRTILNVEDDADKTDADNVNAAGATMNTDTDVSGNDWVLDEDTMTSNSATKVPTQQSVKSYVDANVGTSKVARAALQGAVWARHSLPNSWPFGTPQVSTSGTVTVNSDGSYTLGSSGAYVEAEFTDSGDISDANSEGVAIVVGMIGASVNNITVELVDDSSGGATLTADTFGDTSVDQEDGLAILANDAPGLGVSGFRIRITRSGGVKDMRVSPLFQYAHTPIPPSGGIDDDRTTLYTTWSSQKINGTIGVAGAYAQSREITANGNLLEADEGKTLLFTGLTKWKLTIPSGLDFDAPTKLQTTALGATVGIASGVTAGGQTGTSTEIEIPPNSYCTLTNPQTNSWRIYYSPELTPEP